jgi:hypothetical protein
LKDSEDNNVFNYLYECMVFKFKFKNIYQTTFSKLKKCIGSVETLVTDITLYQI